MHIGVVGCGFVGGSLVDCFQEKGHHIHAYDKYKNIGTLEEVIEKSEIIFLCLPTLYDEENKSYDTHAIHETCNALSMVSFRGPVVIKSTVTPGTSDELVERYGLNIIHNPEFLTATTALDDFKNQTHIVLGRTKNTCDESLNMIRNFYAMAFKTARMSICTAFESEVMKLTCNCFYAVKVQFFNEIHALVGHNQQSYDTVIDMCLKNGWIHPMHTKVPGTDGKYSFGGMCFPKDTRALSSYMQQRGIINGVLKGAVEEQRKMRED
jgi:nucleotide sugar dehydrogenase